MKRMAPPILIPFLFLLLSLTSCAPRMEIHLHDRHALSFPLVEGFCRSHPGATLVLFDYHHDAGPLSGGLTSYDWVGRLIREGRLSRVIWVSGRSLLLPNRNARLAWLSRKLSALPPSESQPIKDRILLADWGDLQALRLHGPLVASLDLDLLTKDPGNPPERFLDEIAAWMAQKKPSLVTVALSAAYQPDADAAWAWLGRWAADASPLHARWTLEAGNLTITPESAEEEGAWLRWKSDPEGFLPGEAVWLRAPQALRSALLGEGIKAGDAGAADILSAWRDTELATLGALFPPSHLEVLASAARKGLADAWAGIQGAETEPAPAAKGLGIAVRLRENGADRGCLAFPGRVADLPEAAKYCASHACRDPRYPVIRASEASLLQMQISLFGPWSPMKGALDFRPGVDSLLLDAFGRKTLLQAPLAVERGLGQEGFLSLLSEKAGLGAEGWREPGLRFRRAATVWRDMPAE